MALFKVLVASFTLATALASPHYRGGGQQNHNHNHNTIHTLGDAAASCANHQQISCCNTGSTVGGLLDNVLGGNCQPLNLAVLAVTVPISQACSGQVACCSGDQNGLINVACTNVNV